MSTAENLPHLNPGDLSRINELTEAITKQNSLYSDLIESGAISTYLLREATVEHLSTEQSSSYTSLLEAASAIPYERLGQSEAQLQSKLADISMRLLSIDEEVQEETERIREEGQLVTAHLPELEPTVDEITSAMKQRIVEVASTELVSEKNAAESEYEAVVASFSQTSQAWPIPRLVPNLRPAPVSEGLFDPHTTSIEITKSSDNELLLVDEYSTPYSPRPVNEVVENIRRKHSEEKLRDASMLFSLVLIDEPGRSFTGNELAEALYGDSQYMRRVYALVSNYRTGKTGIIGDSLHEFGLALQCGRRRTYLKGSGKEVGVCKIVYRAVPIDSAELKERIVYTTPDHKLVLDDWEHIVADEPDATTVETTPKEAATTPISSHEEDVSEPEKSKLNWEERLKDQALETLQQFLEYGMIKDAGELMTRRQVRSISPSRIMGTPTMADRAHSAGIITKAEKDDDVLLPIYKHVCMALLNRHPEVFSARTRRKKALKIIEELTASFIADLAKSDAYR